MGSNGERSGLQTHIAAMESVSLCGRMKADCVKFPGALAYGELL
jgi:hypothetical protein